jgi:hypothetical protein
MDQSGRIRFGRYVGDCMECGDPVYALDAAYPITGWEIARSGGGANQIKHRERMPNMVCHPEPCMARVVRREKGQPVHEQESLLGHGDL